jgi:hypothetical protein
MGCQYLDETYDLFLLGSLPAEDCARVREHLEGSCPNCLERLCETGKCVYLLAQMIRPGRPGPNWRSNLLRRLKKK